MTESYERSIVRSSSTKEAETIRELTGEQQAFVEELGLAMEGLGLARMAGRVHGVLLMADPPEVSAEDLATVLRASRGSISSSTRMLELMGLLERISKPGERRDYFRLKPNAWYEITVKRTAAISYFRQLAEKGLTVLDSDSPEVRRGLEEMRDFYRFFEKTFPKLFEMWLEEKQKAEAPQER